MVKLLHAADLHLDSAFSALPPEKAVQRRAEQRLVLERLTALSEGCAAVLLAGDLFDSARVYRDTLEALRAALAACRCPVFIAPGNHDALLPGSPPHMGVKITVSMDARGFEGKTECKWIMVDSDNNDCFPNSSTFTFVVSTKYDYQ